MLGATVVYAGLVLAFLGAVSLLKPLRFLRIRTRRTAAAVAAAGLALVVIGVVLPVPHMRVAAPQSHLDEFAPEFQFHEFHELRVHASPDAVYRAIREVTADEIWLLRTLTWIRRGGRAAPESILNPGRAPIIDVATSGGFLLLADEPGREVVLGAIVLAPPGTRGEKPTLADYQALALPGFAKATMNFRIVPGADGTSLVTTETRVFATDAAAERAFARYWRFIYPGSALLRRTWLRAIRNRAEAR